jgi:hypothetical protein
MRAVLRAIAGSLEIARCTSAASSIQPGLSSNLSVRTNISLSFVRALAGFRYGKATWVREM